MSHDRAAAMAAYYQAYNSGDWSRLEAFYADDLVLTSSNGVIDGKVAMRAMYEQILAAFEDRMTPTRILSDGDVAMTEVDDVLTATIDVPDFFGNAVAAGQALTMKLAGVYEFEGDRIRRVALYGR